MSGAVHPASADPVPPLRSDAGAAAPSHAVQTLLCTKPALQAALRTCLHPARGESAVAARSVKGKPARSPRTTPSKRFVPFETGGRISYGVGKAVTIGDKCMMEMRWSSQILLFVAGQLSGSL